MRLPDTSFSSELGTSGRIFLRSSVEMISNFSGRRGRLSDWTPFLVRKSYYKRSEFQSFFWRRVIIDVDCYLAVTSPRT